MFFFWMWTGPNPAQISIPVPQKSPTAGLLYNDFGWAVIGFLTMQNDAWNILCSYDISLCIRDHLELELFHPLLIFRCGSKPFWVGLDWLWKIPLKLFNDLFSQSWLRITDYQWRFHWRTLQIVWVKPLLYSGLW